MGPEQLAGGLHQRRVLRQLHGRGAAAREPHRPRRCAARLFRLERRCGGGARGNGALRGGDRKSVVEGKSVDLGGRRIIKKKKKMVQGMLATNRSSRPG